MLTARRRLEPNRLSNSHGHVYNESKAARTQTLTRLADIVRSACRRPLKTVSTEKTRPAATREVAGDGDKQSKNKTVYTLSVQSCTENGLTQFTVTTPCMLAETRNKVVVLYQYSSSSSGNGSTSSKQVLHLLVNYILGVTYDDDFQFELPRFTNDDPNQLKDGKDMDGSFVVAFPRQEDSQVQYNVIVVVLAKQDACAGGSIFASPLVNSLLESKVIDHVDCFLVALIGKASAINDADLVALRRQQNDNDKTALIAVLPREDAIAHKRRLSQAQAQVTQTFSVAYETATQYDFSTNSNCFKSLFSELASLSQYSHSTSTVVTEERVQLEDYILLNYQSMQETFKVLAELQNDMQIVEKHKKEMLTGKTFTEVFQVVEKTMVEINQTNTYCLVCRVVCHEDCGLENDGDKYKCWAMKANDEETVDDPEAFCIRGKCVGVPHGCSWMMHKNMKQIERERIIRVERTSAELVQRYNWRENEPGLDEHLQKTYEEKLTELASHKNKWRRAINRLSEIDQESKNLSLLESFFEEMRSEIKKQEKGYEVRVEQMMQACANVLDKVDEKDVPKECRKTLEEKRKSIKNLLFRLKDFKFQEEKEIFVLRAVDQFLKTMEKSSEKEKELDRMADKAVNKTLQEATESNDQQLPMPETKIGLTDSKKLKVEFTYTRIVIRKNLNVAEESPDDERKKFDVPRPTAVSGWLDDIESFNIDNPKKREPKPTPKEIYDKRRDLLDRYSLKLGMTQMNALKA